MLRNVFVWYHGLKLLLLDKTMMLAFEHFQFYAFQRQMQKYCDNHGGERPRKVVIIMSLNLLGMLPSVSFAVLLSRPCILQCVSKLLDTNAMEELLVLAMIEINTIKDSVES